MRFAIALALAFAAALLAACATPPSTLPAPGGVPGGVAPPPAGLPTLASEQRRLADELRGTPVTVEITTEGRLRVEVPLEFSFDRGRAAVKKPLAAVLDRIATGLRRQPAFEVRVAAPTDARGAGGELFARDRAASVRDYLVARGVPVTQFAGIGRGSDDGVDVLIGERPTASR